MTTSGSGGAIAIGGALGATAAETPGAIAADTLGAPAAELAASTIG